MKEKLSFNEVKTTRVSMKNLRIFNSVNPSGCVIRTPEVSEIGELSSRYRLADWLYHVSTKNKVARSSTLGMLSILIASPWLVISTAYYAQTIKSENDLKGWELVY